MVPDPLAKFSGYFHNSWRLWPNAALRNRVFGGKDLHYSDIPDLLRAELGDEIVRADDLAPYLTDFWQQYQGNSPIVLRPRSTAEVAAIVKLANQHKIPLVPQSGNTGLVRGGIPDESGTQIVVSMERLNRIREIDDAGDFMIAEAGCVLTDIQNAADGANRLFPLSLGSEGTCRIGSNISTNAGGVNVLRYGMTRALVMGLEVVLADGTVWDGLRALKKDNTGYDLKQLFIGAEGSLGIVTAAVLRLFPRPLEVQTCWLAINDPSTAIDLLKLFQDRFGEMISSFELLTGFGVNAAVTHLDGVRMPVETKSDWHVLIELAWSLPQGLQAQLEAALENAVERDLILDGTIALSDAQRANMWRIREGQSEATRHIGHIIRSDVSVKTASLPELIGMARRHFDKSAPGVTLIPFGHVGDGNLHFNLIAPENSEDIASLRTRLLDELGEMVAKLNGSFSAEHGIGRLKCEELAKRKSGIELQLMRQLKSTLDPNNILNPGVILG